MKTSAMQVRRAIQVHKSWLIPSVLVLLVTVLTDGIVAEFMARPFHWCEWIAASLPLSFSFFVIVPLLKRENEEPQDRANG